MIRVYKELLENIRQVLRTHQTENRNGFLTTKFIANELKDYGNFDQIYDGLQVLYTQKRVVRAPLTSGSKNREDIKWKLP
jgi:hypothetical protein